MRTIFAITFLLFSFLGYSNLIKDKFNINTALIPFIIVTSYIFIIAIAARFSLMLLSIVVTNIIGVYFFFKYINKKDNFRKLFPQHFIFIFSIFILAICLNGRKFIFYDDFSHWATISRLLIRKDAINTNLDLVIDFKSYPQSSAYFIYGVVRFLGYSESNMMIANSIIPLSGAFCFLSISKKRLVNYIMSILIIIFVLIYNIRPYALLVDTMLASTAFGIFSYIFIIDKDSYNENIKYFLVPMFVSLVYLKNSGLFLAIFVIVFIFIKFWKIDKSFIIVSLLSVFIANKSWSNHIKNEFVFTGKHGMNIESYKKVFEENKVYIDEFRIKFFKNILTDKFMWVLLVSLIIILIFTNRKDIIKKILIATVLIYVIYQTGNYFMYITSMTIGELRRLACYDRYIRTIHIFIFLINMYTLNYYFDKKLYVKLITFIISLYYIFILGYPEEIRLENDSFRDRLSKIRIENKIQSDKKILIKFENKDISRIFTRATMYEFDTNKITDTFINDKKSHNPNDFDYYIDLSK